MERLISILVAIILCLNTQAEAQEPIGAEWQIYIGTFSDYFVGDFNTSLQQDGSIRQFLANKEFNRRQGFEIAVERKVLSTKLGSLYIGLGLANKRKIITNRLRFAESPFEDSTLYGVDAYYLSVPITFVGLQDRFASPMLAIEPGYSVMRYERNESMRTAGIPDRFDSIWKANVAIAPGVDLNITKALSVRLQGRYYLHNMFNDYSGHRFRTMGWKAGITLKLF